ncbi:bile acid:sodium symporter family protein [Arcanobacterium pinnipediorum]|uniref:Bile acid:sodium symporter n=1 Tax=Arcanobacterium pinnipediorum TaxID=1503041 RepID=A0ABY5AG25_9ACTO|nr:bile acid:sodium symporter family protein [Arcanobacterium pinnipediorum]USR78656.1 bile acid:sodium symporter [Arcanobacterium pinnipediorum]
MGVVSRYFPRFDPLITGIITALFVGLLIPVSAGAVHFLSHAADVGVALVFLLYGMRLSTREVLRGLTNIRLQGFILAATFLIFPLLSWGLSVLAEPLIGRDFALGILFLGLLPSTVQSSVTFVSIARGDIASAIAAATVSNIAGMFITPALVVAFMDMSGASTGGFSAVLTNLLLPFIIGQCLQPWFGDWIRARRHLTRRSDTGAIILVVLAATLSATADGAWSVVTPLSLLVLVAVLVALLSAMLAITWFGAQRLPREERIVALMCGSKKSLATGLPMAKALFPTNMVGTIGIPVIIFHQIQLVVCAAIARILASATERD